MGVEVSVAVPILCLRRGDKVEYRSGGSMIGK